MDDSEAHVEGFNRALDAIAQLHKDWDDRFTFNRPHLLKRYLDGRIGFQLEFRAWSSPNGNPVDLYAVLNREGITSGGERRQLDPQVRGFVPGDCDFIAENKSVGNDYEKPVFFCDVEVVDNLQNRIDGVRCPVWLKRFDQRVERPRNALYYSVFHGLFKFIGGPTDRKVDSLIVGDTVFTGKCPDDMIEARPKMMNDFADNDRKTERNWWASELESISAAFRLTLSDNGVSTTVQEGGNLIIEILDLLFGPLDLSSAPIERM